MGIVYDVVLVPSKQELVAAWVPTQPWYRDEHRIVDRLAEYRFDDPAGEVGVETILWRTADGGLMQTPLTYRGAPLAGAEQYLVGQLDHPALGPRWVYSGYGDPVWAKTLAAAILTGATQVGTYVEVDGRRVDVPVRMQVRGTGAPGTEVPPIESITAVRADGPLVLVDTDGGRLVVAREVGAAVHADAALIGGLPGAEPSTLAGYVPAGSATLN